jgi:hypothetical protein
MHLSSCIHCGYDLTAHVHMESCPECGHAVLDSTPQHQLIAAGPAWPKRWRIACRILSVLLALELLLFHLPLVFVMVSPEFSRHLAFIEFFGTQGGSVLLLVAGTLLPALLVWWITQPGRIPNIDTEAWTTVLARWSMMGVAVLSSEFIVDIGMIPTHTVGPRLLATQGHLFIACVLVLLPHALPLLATISLLRWRRALSSIRGRSAGRALDRTIIALWVWTIVFELQAPVATIFRLDISVAYRELTGSLVLWVYWLPQVVVLLLLLWRVWATRSMFDFMPDHNKAAHHQRPRLHAHRASVTSCLQGMAIWFVLCFLWNTLGGLVQVGLVGRTAVNNADLDPQTLLLAGIVGCTVTMLLPGLIGAARTWLVVNRWLLLVLGMSLLVAWSGNFALSVWDVLMPTAGLLLVGFTTLIQKPAIEVR